MTEDVAGVASDEAVAPASRLRGPALGLVMVMGTAGILLNINRLFNFQFFVGKLLIDTSYFYLLAGTFLSLVFLVYPYRSKRRDRRAGSTGRCSRSRLRLRVFWPATASVSFRRAGI